MYAVIQTGGKQYLVAEGRKYKFEKLPGNPGDAVAFDRVLLAFDGEGENVRVGTPTIAGARVSGTIAQQGRARKVDVIKYKAKVRYRRKLGHRQHFTEVEIERVNG
jgi:large subunit ribosomal protein L21